jgi:tetratricopeptide (TPR) repeat protein
MTAPLGAGQGRSAREHAEPAETIAEPLETSLREQAMATRRHVTEPMARAFFRGTLNRDDYRRVVRHLIRRCERCLALMRRMAIEEGFFRSPRAKGHEFAFEDILFYPEAERFSLAVGRIMGLAQLAFLETVPPEARVDLVRRTKGFQHMGLYDRLIEQAVEETDRDPAAAGEVVALALAVAAEIKTAATLRNDLMATGYAVLGNARRLARDFAGARDAYTKAWAYREEGTADPLVDARIMQQEAAWFVDLGEFEAAEVLLQNALKEYRLIKDTHREGRTLLKLAALRMHADPQSALALFAQAEPLFDLKEEPRLAWCLRHNVIWCMADLGQTEEALALLEQCRSLYQKFGRRDWWVTLRLHWLEGRLALSLGHSEDAEDILRRLFLMLEVESQHIMAPALVAVDLVRAIAVQTDRTRDAILMIDRTLPTLRNRGLHREGISLWLSLKEEIAEGRAGEIKWREIQEYFRRTWYKPAPFGSAPPS